MIRSIHMIPGDAAALAKDLEEAIGDVIVVASYATHEMESSVHAINALKRMWHVASCLEHAAEKADGEVAT